MKTIIASITAIFLLITSLSAEDIKPPEIKEMLVIGAGPTMNASMSACQDRMYNSCKQIQTVSNRDSQWTGAGWITTYQVTYKVVH